MLLELKNRPNNLSNIYLLINDLLHPRNLVFNADVKVLRCNSPIYQKFFVYLYIFCILLHCPRLLLCFTKNALVKNLFLPQSLRCNFNLNQIWRKKNTPLRQAKIGLYLKQA